MSKSSVAIIDHVGMKAGLDHYDLSLANALSSQNVDVCVYSNFNSDKEFVKNHFDFSFSRNIFRVISLIFDYIKAMIRIKRKNTNWVILHMFHFSLTDLMLLKLINIYNIKKCLIIHDIENLIVAGQSHFDSCLKYANHIVVHNSFVEELLKQRCGNLSPEKISVIPHGNYINIADRITRNSAMAKMRLNADKKYILFFGMIKTSKGLNVLIDAMTNTEEDVHLIVAGRTRDVDEVVIRKHASHLGPRFHLMNRYISNIERNVLFSLADILIIPYNKVYQSGVLLLGMSYGVPVIASDIQPNRLIVKESNGLLFKSGDSADLAVKINELISDQSKSKDLGNAGMEYVREFHDWNVIGKKFKTIFSV